MALTLLAGPANAGKVALLLERYLAALGQEPFLIVPNRSDVERVERELLASCGALLGGEIGTFDDLFARVARGEPGGHRPVATDAQRALIVRRVLAGARLNGWTQSARYAGFADALSAALGELESGLVEPGDLDGDLAGLYGEYRAELDRLGLWDRDLERRTAAERLAGELRAWEGRPVFAYGFEDLTGAQWALLEALAGRTEITVSLPYEPGRPAFASLERTADDLSRLASPRIEELPAKPEVRPPALAHVERTLFGTTATAPANLDGAIRFFEGAGRRGTLELVAEELLRLVRGGTRPEEIALVCPRVESYRAPLETALGSLGVPYSVEGRIRLDQTELGQALISLLRFAWQDGGRGDLYGFLRSPYSGLARASVDWVEGRLRGRAVEAGERTEEETMRLRDGHPLPALELVRKAATPLAAVQDLARFMLRAAYGLESPPVGERSREDLRAFEALSRLVGELEGWLALGGTVTPDEIAAALERAPVRAGGAGEAGRVDVIDLLRARTRRYEVVFVLGLEEGALPRRGEASPFLDEEVRRDLEERLRHSRLSKPEPVARDRYLFYTACTRATRRLYLVREAATDEGSPREPSPFWDEARGLFPEDEVRRATTRRALSALTWPVEQAPTERERPASRRAPPRPSRALGTAQVFRRSAEEARGREARPGAARRGARVPTRVSRGGDGRSPDGADRPTAARARAGPAPRSRSLRARRGDLGPRARPAPVRGFVRVGAVVAGAAARARSRHLHALRQDRPDRPRPVQRARDRPGLQVGEDRALGGADRVGAEAADPAVHARPPRPRRGRAPRRDLPGAFRKARRARAAARRGEGRRRPRLLAERLPRRGGLLGAGRPRRRARARLRRSDPRRRRAARPEGRRLPAVVRALADVPGDTRMSRREPNPEQRAAIDARGHVFVSAGAGTGKTLVLVERFANAVCDEGLDVGSVLVITYTERAAGELRGRIRRELLERGRDDLARELDGAWISTIHGFCHRLLKTYPFAAGLDPRFRVLDDSQARVLRGEAFEDALGEFCTGDDPRRLRLLATYGAGGLRRMLTGVYETLRAAGRPLELRLGESPGLGQRVEALREAAQCLVDEEGFADQRAQAMRMLELLERDRQAEDLLDLSEPATRGRPP